MKYKQDGTMFRRYLLDHGKTTRCANYALAELLDSLSIPFTDWLKCLRWSNLYSERSCLILEVFLPKIGLEHLLEYDPLNEITFSNTDKVLERHTVNSHRFRLATILDNVGIYDLNFVFTGSHTIYQFVNMLEEIIRKSNEMNDTKETS